MLRSPEAVMGLPELKHESERWKITLGNQTMKISAAVAMTAWKQLVPFTIENPFMSLIWLAPAFRALARRRGVSDVRTDFCQWGTPWMKPTRILGGHVDMSIVARTCRMRKGICSRSGCRHVVLAGLNKDKVFMTKLAEPYPPSFASQLAKVHVNAEKAKMMNSMTEACLR